MRSIGLRHRVVLLFVCVAIGLPLVAQRCATAQHNPLRLSVNKWKVEPGDNYTLSWMESGSVQPMSDFIIEEGSDPQFKERDNYSRYVVRAHRKAFENSTAFSHTVRYYRIRARAWVRNAAEQQVEDEVVSNTVRVTLLGTDKSPAPSFPDDPEEPAVKPSKDKDKDKKKKNPEDDYPAMGRPDFVVSRITIEPAVPVVGKPFKVRASIRNIGVVPSESVQVKIDAAGRQFIVECEALKPQFAIDVVSPPVICDKAGPTEVKVLIDPFERIAESREDNNGRTLTVTVGEAPSKTSTQTPPTPDGSGAK